MRLLIAKLASASVQSVSVALNSETDLAEVATDIDNCLQLLRGGRYDLVLLILSQGQVRSRDVVAQLRREAGHIPIIVLTEAAAQELPAAAGTLAAGAAIGTASRATDPLTELVAAGTEAGVAPPWAWDEPPLPETPEPARHRQHRRSPSPRHIIVDMQTESLRIDEQPVGLSQAEFRIFARLWEHRGRIVTAEDLMGAIYGQGERPASRVLPVFLFKLRRKLSPLGLGDLVETAIGRGFTIRGDTDIEAQT